VAAFFTVLRRSVRSFGSDKCATFSAAIAYYAVFALFPMALVGVSILGFFMGDEAARRRVVAGITDVIALGDDGRAALEKTLAGVGGAKGWLGLIGLATAVWSAGGLFGAIRAALDAVWGVDRPLPLLRAKARDLVLFFGCGGLLFASTAGTGVLQGARAAGARWLGPRLDSAEPLFALLLFVAPLVLTFCAFMVLYRLGPHARLTWSDVWPAAAIAAFAFEFGKNLLTYYITNLGNFNALAGSLGAAILFLVFVYYAAQVTLFAAEFAKHRLLVRAGTLPATDPKARRPPASLMARLKDAAVHLWKADEPHHDTGLPHEPSRLDPATNRPTTTREEGPLPRPPRRGPTR
jgi:membrane protein